jgi:hypothetical protein
MEQNRILNFTKINISTTITNMLINKIFYNPKSKNTKTFMKQKGGIFLAFETIMNAINP